MLHQIDVTCYAGYRGNEKPLKFTFQNNEFEIKKILHRSVEESLSHRNTIYRFRVLCTDNQTFSLLYNPQTDLWLLEEGEKT